MEWDKLWQIEPTLEGGYDGSAMRPSQREAEEIEVAVNDVELLDLSGEFTECDSPERREVSVVRAMMPERLIHDRVETSGGV